MPCVGNGITSNKNTGENKEVERDDYIEQALEFWDFRQANFLLRQIFVQAWL